MPQCVLAASQTAPGWPSWPEGRQQGEGAALPLRTPKTAYRPCAGFWDPHHKRDRDTPEEAQLLESPSRLGMEYRTHTQGLREMGLVSLKTRRPWGDLTATCNCITSREETEPDTAWWYTRTESQNHSMS